MQARTTTSSLGEPQRHTNTPLRALEADQDQDVSPMSHVTAISPHATNTHKHTAEHLTVTTGAAAPHINPFPNLGALRVDGSASPCPPEDVIPSPRRGGDGTATLFKSTEIRKRVDLGSSSTCGDCEVFGRVFVSVGGMGGDGGDVGHGRHVLVLVRL